MCFDANNLYIGEFNGKEVHELYHKDSHVQRKHDAGGQSQRRFERGRGEALKHWFKDIEELVMDFQHGRPIYLGCNNMYKNRIKLKKIKFTKGVSIDDNCLWELMEVSRNDQNIE